MSSVPGPPPEDVARFHALGYLVLQDVVSADDIAEVQALLDPLFDRFDALPKRVAVDLGGASAGARPSIPELNGTTQLEPRLLRTQAFARCRRIAQALLGQRVTFWGDHAIYKPPHNQRATAWHQDQAYAGHRLSTGVVTFWVPLQDVTADMGCMQFLPGSHRGGLVPHTHRDGAAKSGPLMIRDVDEAAAVACPIPAGSATVHSALTIHATGPNTTDRYRRAWILAFSPRHRFGVVRAATAVVNLARAAATRFTA